MPTERRGNNRGGTEDAASEGCCDEAFVLAFVLTQTLSCAPRSWSWYAAPKRSSFIRGILVGTELAKLIWLSELAGLLLPLLLLALMPPCLPLQENCKTFIKTFM